MTDPTSAEAYLAALPAEQRAALEHLRAIVLAVAPDAADAISYKMPALRYRGRVLLSYAAFRNHCSLFPWSVAVIESMATELAGYRGGKGTLQFRPDAPMPDELVERIGRARVAELDALPPR